MVYLVAVIWVVHGPLCHWEGEVHGPARIAVESHVSCQDPPPGVEPNTVAAQEGVALTSDHHVLIPTEEEEWLKKHPLEREKLF